jgi:sigma-E factor negative regulatory protein RseC
VTGRVQAVSGKTVIIGADESAACFGCMNRECRARGRFYTAENPRALPLAPGQLVETGNSRRALLFQALAVLLPPVLGFAAGFAAADALTANEALSIRGGFMGLLFTALAVYLFRRYFPPKTVPEVFRIAEKTGTPDISPDIKASRFQN